MEAVGVTVNFVIPGESAILNDHEPATGQVGERAHPDEQLLAVTGEYAIYCTAELIDPADLGH